MGHTSIAGTAYYLNMTPALLTEACERFNRYALPQKEFDNE
jgi:hypothetical protein